MGFNRINSGRSIPTSGGYTQAYDITGQVSIVSIQADQSRQGWMTCDEVSLVKFQSYQFRQINPDDVSELEMRAKVAWAFQSYQFRQINPDDINTKPVFVPSKAFQSYQFRQINPDYRFKQT